MKRANLIGLNYAKSPYQLGGCENDAEALRLRMPKNAVVHRFIGVYSSAAFYFDCAELRDECQENDFTVIAFSGHGTQVPNATEPDGWEGGLCFWNGSQIEVIPETDFKRAISQIPGSVVVYLDSCFSGEMAREAGNDRPKFIPFDPERMQVKRFATTPILRAVEPANKVYYLLACAADEVAYDMGDGGKFTKAFCKGFDRLPKSRRIKDVMAYAAGLCQPAQTPMLKCEGGARSTKMIF